MLRLQLTGAWLSQLVSLNRNNRQILIKQALTKLDHLITSENAIETLRIRWLSSLMCFYRSADQG